MNAQQPTALGETPADTLVRGGRVCLVEAGEFRRRDVAIRAGRIAALPEDGSPLIGPDTDVVDADGRPVIPGLIDAHTHVDIRVAFERLYPYALRGGTTTVVTESNGFGSSFPVAGAEQLLEATADLPIDLRIAASPQACYDLFEPQSGGEETVAGLLELLEADRVVALGEISWIYVVGRSDPVSTLVERANALGKPVTGHGAGCSGEKLTAFATVVDDDHEPIAAEEAIERIENGLHVVGRYGSRDDVEAVAGAYDRFGPEELSLSTDGMPLERLLEGEYMNLVVRRAIEAGIEPVDAVRMATLNPARHFGLEGRGTLAPGAHADLVVLEGLDSMAVDTVLFEGERVVGGGRSLVEPRPYDYPAWFRDTVDVAVDPGALRIPADVADRDGRVRGIEFVGGMVTRETSLSPPIEDGVLLADPGGDVQKVAVLEREADEPSFVGFVTGFDLDADAVATTTAMQLPAVLAVGSDDAAIARALERLSAIGGGWVVVDDSAPAAEFPLPIGGSVASVPAPEGYDRLNAVRSAFGSERSDVRVGISSLAFTGVPALKLTFSGYADVIRREVVGLSPES